MQFIKNFVREEEGQDVLEYGLLMGFVAVVAYVGIQTVGTNLSDLWTALGTQVGKASTAATTAAGG
jgi:Flp pilus assembly pilin Flp